MAGRKVLFWRTANQVQVDNASFIDFNQGTTATAPPSISASQAAAADRLNSAGQEASGARAPLP